MLAGRPHGSTTRRWVTRKHQGYASLAACSATYAGNATGLRHQPPMRNTTDTQQERRFLPRASHVRHGELGQCQPPMRNTTETQPERRFWPRTSRVTQGGLGGEFCWLSEPRALLERTLHGKCTTAHAEDMDIGMQAHEGSLTSHGDQYAHCPQQWPKTFFGKWLEMPATNSKPKHESTINKLTVRRMLHATALDPKTQNTMQKNSKREKVFQRMQATTELPHLGLQIADLVLEDKNGVLQGSIGSDKRSDLLLRHRGEVAH